MKVYTCTTFEGHYPVGSAAVIVAESEEQARELLDAELKRHGLKHSTPDDALELLDTSRSQAIVLNDGDY